MRRIRHYMFLLNVPAEMTKYKFTLNEEFNYLYTQYFGVLSFGDFRECIEQGNVLYPGIDSIVDLSEASLVNITRQDIESLVQLAIVNEPRHIKVAFVTPKDLEFGLARMFDSHADVDLPQKRVVFRTLEAAQTWLQELREDEKN